MIKNYKLIFLLIFQLPFLVFSQGENDHWIFGSGAHVSFRNGIPEVLEPLSKFLTKEGCSSVSDENGNLLFYSDGITIWNKQHQVMMNGNGLMGHSSSTSSCVIIPFPGHIGKYYVFTVQPNIDSDHYLSYNVIDLNLNNGLGMVIEKNKILLNLSDEKIAVTRHCNGIDFWVVFHKALSNEYHSYLLSSNGLSQKPIISKIQETQSYFIELGYLKFSPDGKWLVNALCLESKLIICKFDIRTGKITHYKTDVETNRSIAGGQSFYGVAFSPSGNKLYASCFEKGVLFQYDLSVDSINFLKSKTMIIDLPNSIGAIQLAKNGKIYMTNGYNTYTLNSIEYPELTKQNCNFVTDKIRLNTMSHLGLPTYVEAVEKYFNLGVDTLIKQKKYTLETRLKGARHLWSTGDTTESITVFKSGIYSVQVWSDKFCAVLSDKIEVKFLNVDLSMNEMEKREFHFCENSKLEIPNFTTDFDSVEFYWKNSDTTFGLPSNGVGNLPKIQIGNVEKIVSAEIEVYPLRAKIFGPSIKFNIVIHPKVHFELPNSNRIVCSQSEIDLGNVLTKPINMPYMWIRKQFVSGVKDTGYNFITTYKPSRYSEQYKDTILVKNIDDYCPQLDSFFTIVINSRYQMRDTVLSYCSNQWMPSIDLKSVYGIKGVRWNVLDSNIFDIKEYGKDTIYSKFLKLTWYDKSTKISTIAQMPGCPQSHSTLTITSMRFPKFISLGNQQISLCSGDSLDFSNRFKISNNEFVKWEANNSYLGIGMNGNNVMPKFKSPIRNYNTSTSINFQVESKLCIGEKKLFNVVIKGLPKTLPLNDTSVCIKEEMFSRNFMMANINDTIYYSIDRYEESSPKQTSELVVIDKLSALKQKTYYNINYYAVNKSCHGDTLSFQLSLFQYPKLSINLDTFLDVSEAIFNNKSYHYDNLFWQFSDGHIDNGEVRSHIFPEDYDAKVMVIGSNASCLDTTYLNFYVPYGVYNHIPNAFSPNDNLKNEEFKVYNSKAEKVSFSIFNKWGENIYTTSNNSPWDGKYKGVDCPQDVYVYLVKMDYSNGESKTFKGTVTLLR